MLCVYNLCINKFIIILLNMDSLYFKNYKKLIGKSALKPLLIVLAYVLAIIILIILSAVFKDTYWDFFLCGALILLLRVTNFERRKFFKNFVKNDDSEWNHAEIIEQNDDKKNVKIKDVLVPILLVLFSIVVPIVAIVIWTKFDSYWDVSACFGFLSFIFGTTALVLYIRDNKCLKLIKSLILEIFNWFVLFCSVVSEGNNMWLWRFWLFCAVLYLILWFYRTFKLWFECKLQNNKWYNKWWFRFILVVVVSIVLWLFISFLTVHCDGIGGLICTKFHEMTGDFIN